jgi:hypothetical protein
VNFLSPCLADVVRVPRLVLLSALLGLLSAPVRAVIELSIGIDDIAGEDWRAEGIRLSLSEAEAGRLAVSIELRELVLPGDHGAVQGLRLLCPLVESKDGGWRCSAGRLVLEASPIQAQDAAWHGSFRRDASWQLEIPRLAIARGTVALALSGGAGAWTAEVRPVRVSVPRLAKLARMVELPGDWGIGGAVSGRVRIDGEAARPSRLDADLVVDQLSYASPDGSQAAEKVVLKTAAKARLQRGAWYFDASLGWPTGAVYAEPLFLDAGQGPLTATVTGNWQQTLARLQLDGWSLDVADTVNISGTGQFIGAGLAIKDLTIAAQSGDAGRLYRRLLQPYVIGTAADDMEVSGRVGVVLHFDDQGIEQAGLELNRLALQDRRGRFSLDRTDGSVGWDRSKAVPVSRLTVEGASVYRIPTGGFSINARFAGERIDLVEPVVVEVLGGAVALDSFALTGALMAGDKPRWEASASVRDVSLEQLTRTLEWQPFNGTVTGQLRKMRYADQVFSVGGGLELGAFGGNIRVDGLTIREPFGTVPVLEADATMRGLNLEALTETFSFGRIEGRLDADVRGIQLVGWQPDRFDLHLYTPDNDDSRHRISQRAVENLTELGSGIPAGLSATILRVFEEFRYDRIDLKIRLQGSAAQLDGLARPDGGYYLVKGSGLPRIDVIGRNRSVAWKDLVERLQQIQVEGAQIQ